MTNEKIIEYRGYIIDCGATYENMITVQDCGDDVVFETIEDAKQFYHCLKRWTR